MVPMQVALIQLCSGPNIEENLYVIENLLQENLKIAPDILLLPECFASMSGDILFVGKNEKMLRKWMSEKARKYNCCIVRGKIPYSLMSGKKHYSSCFIYNNQGNEIARYDKIHLFDANLGGSKGSFFESDDYLAGDKHVTVSLGVACLGLSVCYDVRFPELYRNLVEDGANILCVPSAFTAFTGKHHWEALLRARAIENQSFIFAPNQGGRHPCGRESWGHSMIISPWGEVLGEAVITPSLLSVEIDLSIVSQLRSEMPCLDHKKL